jgi:hypothetical protein
MKYRRSVPTYEVQAWWGVGWAYVCPDFDNPGYSIVEWLSAFDPVMPAIRSEAAE